MNLYKYNTILRNWEDRDEIKHVSYCVWNILLLKFASFSLLQMMQNLLLEEGGLVQVESVNLMVATYSKFQPQSPDFLDITNPKAV